MAEWAVDNQFRHVKCEFELVETRPKALIASGARFEKATLDQEIGPEVVLMLIDCTSFAHELRQRKPFELHLKSGVAQTSIGPVVFLLWWMPPITNGKPFALYEQILDPTYTGTLEGLMQLARQTHLHVLLVGPGQELLEVYEFENSFGLENLVEISENACNTHRGMDFIRAKEEYDRNYELMKLFSTEPGSEDQTPPDNAQSASGH